MTHRLAHVAKRSLDVFISAVSLIVLSPFFLIIAILIRLDSPGSAFFRQLRIGKGGVPFYILKFRTMHSNTDHLLAEHLSSDPIRRLSYAQYQKLWDDPRLTRLGNYLRRYSLDELPQLVNVLRGEMSLVGPRPFLPEQLRLYGQAYKQYIQVRPGITGLWQILGRNRISFSARVRLDVWYFQHWSFWFDLLVLYRTIGVVLRRDGAY